LERTEMKKILGRKPSTQRESHCETSIPETRILRNETPHVVPYHRHRIQSARPTVQIPQSTSDSANRFR
jgi:hypothetical protein